MPSSLTCVKTGPHQVGMTQIPYPDEPGPGQALIRTTLSTICGSDMHLVDDMPIPGGVPMGHEAVGVVQAVGSGVTSIQDWRSRGGKLPGLLRILRPLHGGQPERL